MSDEVRVRSAGSGCLVPLRVQPGAKRSGVAGVWSGHLKLAVAAPALDGRANEALLRLVAELFGLRPSAVALERGHSSRTKVVRLALAPEQARAALRRILGER